MNRIRTGDLLIGLNDLFINKIALIRALAAFAIFGPPLDKMRTLLGSIYRGLTVTPLVKQLSEKDSVHDTAGRLLYFICNGYAQLSTISEERRAFWARVRDTFIPNLSILTMSYADEAAAATLRLKDLETLKSLLEEVSLPENLTLYSLTSTYLQAGVELGEIMSSRVGEEVADEAEKTKQLNVVRLETMGLLSRFREAPAEEVKGNEALPRKLPEQVFGYIDSLAAKRKGRTDASEEIPESDVEDENPDLVPADKAVRA